MASSTRGANPTTKRTEDPQPRKRQESLKPETRHGITIVVLFTVAVIFLLCLLNLAGPLGSQIDRALELLFGGLRYLVPVGFIVFGYLLMFPDQYQVRASTYGGVVLFAMSGTGLLHLSVPADNAVSAIDEGRGGGYIGLLLSAPLRGVIGPIASGVILVALLIIALLVMFNTTLSGLARRGNVVGGWYATLRSWWYRVRYHIEERRQDQEPSSDDDAEGVGEGDPGFDARPVGDHVAPVADSATQAPLFEEEEKVKKPRRNIEIPLDLLDDIESKPTFGRIEEKKELIRKTLETFGIVVEMGEVNVGPAVTQFTLKPSEGVKLSHITTLQNDLALALAAHSLRIEAPIPGMALVGIEIPNETVAVVNLRHVIDSDAFRKRKSNLTFALGKDVAGKPWVANLDPMPHLLIAGATGSGKSVMINSLIVSLLYGNSPDDLKFILIDPKQGVEFGIYNDIPHLLTPVITETKKTINALRWIVAEMDRRFKVLSNAGKRNIQAYHAEVSKDMPYIVLIIDELADLMSVAAQEVEGAIIRLAQMARAVGIHLVVATQRPSVNVITGLIKANITARIAFNVASSIDSRTILDFAGAEKLLGKGDMLFVSSELSKPKRLQGAFLSDAEIARVAGYLKEQASPDYINEVVERPEPMAGEIGSDEYGEDEMLSEAKDLILRSGKASASFLQRRLRVGYARAARLLDLLEERGIIGPGDGAKPREILISRGEFEGAELGDDDADEPVVASGDDTPDTDDQSSDPRS